MASAGPDQNNQNLPLIQRLLGAWQPRIPLFEPRRLAGAPPRAEPEDDEEIHPDADSDIILPIPDDDILQSDDGGSTSTSTSTELLPETDAAAWFAAHVRSTEDIMLSRIPAWGVEGVTTCIFPKLVALRWPSIVYEPIGKAETSCLRVKNVRGKGKGCVAARAVPRGELVARERALLVMPRTCLSPQQFVNDATNKMMPNQRAAFFALHNCNLADLNDALSIISTNSFLIPGVPGHNVLYSAVFETFSRLNHRCRAPISFRRLPSTNKRGAGSCCPNAMFRWDRDTFSGEIRALRPISTGEEVTISYFQGIMGPAAVTHERQKFLLECYNFKCACPVCGQPSKVRNRSDEERPIIFKHVTDIGMNYREMMEDWVTEEGDDRARLPNYLHAVEEGLDREMIFDPTYWIHLARAIVVTRCALGEAKAARKWAGRAAQHMRAATGSDGGWDTIAKEPEKCEWWGVWDKSRLGGGEE